MATAATTMDFEKPIAELERKIDELKHARGRSCRERRRRDRAHSSGS